MEDIRERIEKALNKERWISPEWGPFAACSDEEKELFTVFCDVAASLAPLSLGAISIVFEKCPDNEFRIFEPELNHDPEFLSKRIGNVENS